MFLSFQVLLISHMDSVSLPLSGPARQIKVLSFQGCFK